MTTKAEVLHAIREKCLDCSCYQPGEVRRCVVTACALWPFRLTNSGALQKRPYTRDIPRGGPEWIRLAEGDPLRLANRPSPAAVLAAREPEALGGPAIVASSLAGA